MKCKIRYVAEQQKKEGSQSNNINYEAMVLTIKVIFILTED